MNRPWKVWLVFGLSLAVLLAAIGWVSLTTLRLDRAQAEAGQQAELEERARLALWRMDSSLAPLIVEESARPYSAYFSFEATERALTKSGAPISKGDVLVPSPLLNFSSSHVLLHFQLWPEGALTSPQVPLAEERVLAESGYTTRDRIEAAANRLSHLRNVLNADAPPEAVAAAMEAAPQTNNLPSAAIALRNCDVLIIQCPDFSTNATPPVFPSGEIAVNSMRQSQEGQQSLNSKEWTARANVYQKVQQQAFANNQVVMESPALVSGSGLGPGPLQALWLGGELILARRANTGGRFVIQGCWLNWTNLQDSLKASIQDLFPAAALQARTDLNSDRRARLLAALPVKLVPGAVDLGPLPAWSPVRVSIAVAWLGVLLAGAAVAVLLHGAVSLSERRGAFVSSVTHELRTPLTTFKMYSEMLADGMVPDETQRRHYLATLCSEANRLGHLVENVLAFARLERGSARGHREKLTLDDLIQRVKPRLVQRAEQAGLELVEEALPAALQTVVQVDVSVVEQILFNLVDNACKYAAPMATQRTLHLEASPNGSFAMVRVRDHGRGIPGEGVKRLFRPFGKSAHEAANSAPGVGLGLALCRRLSRGLGGDLRLDATVKNGACFELRLPVA